MAFLVSPGVQVKETDLTNVIPAVSSSIGAISGGFRWGPADQIVSVGSEQQLVSSFGHSGESTFQCFLQAAQFLSYGNTLRVVRVVSADARNASAGGGSSTATCSLGGDIGTAAVPDACSVGVEGIDWTSGDAATCTIQFEADGVTRATYTEAIAATGNWQDQLTCEALVDVDGLTPGEFTPSAGTSVLVKNDDDHASTTYGIADWVIARFPGKMGNSLSVKCSDVDADSEFNIVVTDTTGLITGSVGDVIETFENVANHSGHVSPDGTDNFWVNVVNRRSQWIRIGNEAGLTTAETPLSGGSNNNDNLTLGELQAGYNMFSDPETVEISLLIQSEDEPDLSNHLAAIAADRKDCVAFVSPGIDDTVGNQTPVTAVKTWADTVLHTSYAFADSTALYVYDKYHDAYRWIMASGSMAGLAANADNIADPWWSPAGFTRGGVRNVTRLAFNPKQHDRDDLYKAGINPIVSFAGQGTVLYGDKTLQSKPSAFDRINVRRLFITLEKAISTASKFQLFEFNDEFTRAQFRNMVEPFLRDVKGRRGITDFKVVCDETNNTGDVIDTNRFVADIYIKPARSINFITLNFIATRTGIEFSEIAGGK